MKCRVCSGTMEERVTDLPFKIGDASIVIVRSLLSFNAASAVKRSCAVRRWLALTASWRPWIAPRNWKLSGTLPDPALN